MAEKKNNNEANPSGLPQVGVLVQQKGYQFHDVPAEEKNLGATDLDEQTIAIRVGQPLHTLKDTVLHEVLHAIEHGYRLKFSEKQVCVLAGALLEMLWSNPNLALWLIHRDLEVAPTQAKAAKPVRKTAKVAEPKKEKETKPEEQKKRTRKGSHPSMGFFDISKDGKVNPSQGRPAKPSELCPAPKQAT